MPIRQVKNLSHKLTIKLRSRIYGLLQPNLSAILETAAPQASLGERVAWLEQLLIWIRTPVSPTSEGRTLQSIQSVRVRFLLQLLERNPLWREKFGQALFSILVESEPLNLFCLAGLSQQGGFFSEAFNRISRRALPAPRNECDLAELFMRIFTSDADADWLLNIEPTVLDELYRILAPSSDQQNQLREHFSIALDDALTILAAQIEALALSPEIRLRTGIKNLRQSAFWNFRDHLIQLKHAVAPTNDSTLQQQIISCRSELSDAVKHLEQHGVSIAIVYRLEQIEGCLQRVHLLSRLYHKPSADTGQCWRELMAELILSSLENSRFLPLLNANLRLLARKIVERTGDSGEHYITRSRAEYWQMLASAAGGGALTTVTALLKFAVSKAHSALFFDGLLAWINYSGSFLAMQAMHLSLATKQPSMTAPALAAKLRSFTGAAKEPAIGSEFISEVANLTRSQFIAAVGNVGAIIPCALLFDLVCYFSFGQHVLSPEYAHKIIDSLNPLTSMTVPFAALTGVLLWTASICAGWVENWFAFRRLPIAIAQSPLLRSLVGAKRAASVSHWLQHNISGLGGNISLGFFLAFTPIWGRFFGVALDVRHVTLSAGSLAFAIAATPSSALNAWDIGWAALGILIIGALNFGVSFALALTVAIKARGVRRTWLKQLLNKAWAQMRAQPLYFLCPPKK